MITRTPPQVLIVGPVTRDVVGDRRPPGGSVSYAARTAAAFGTRLAILTIGGPDANLDALAGHDVEFVRADATLTFELQHEQPAGNRKLRVHARPQRPLTAADLPDGWAQARMLMLMPLLPDDIDLDSFVALDPPDGWAVTAQGLQRTVHQSSSVQHISRPSSSLLRCCTDNVTIFLSEEDISGWSQADLHTVIARAGRLIVTRADRGSDIYRAGEVHHVDASPAARVDDTGAGDVFATAFMLAMHEGDEAAARLASAFAAASVECEGPVPLPARAEVEQRLVARAATHPSATPPPAKQAPANQTPPRPARMRPLL